MKESVKKILKKIIMGIIILVVMMIIFSIDGKNKESPERKCVIENRNIIVNIKENEIEVEDNIDLRMDKEIDSVDVNQLIKEIGEIKSVEVDGEKIYYFGGVSIPNSNGKRKVKVKYSFAEENIEKYTDRTNFSMNLCPEIIGYVNNLNITFKLNKPSSIFEIKGKKVEKIAENEYKIFVKNVGTTKNKKIEVSYDSKVSKAGIDRGTSYEQVIKEEKDKYVAKHNNKAIFLFEISSVIILYIAYFVVTGRKIKAEGYKRDWDEVIEPALAEGIVDGKIGTKELIMTAIVDLVTRKNIEVINNDSIRLISKEGLKKYEIKIVNLIFSNSDYISFNEIKNIFISSNNRVREIHKRIYEIRKDIVNYLEEKNLLSKLKKKILKIIRGLAIINIISIFMIISGIFEFMSKQEIFLTLVILFMAFQVGEGTVLEKIEKFNAKNDSNNIKFIMFMIIILFIIRSFRGIANALVPTLVLLLLIILSIILIKLTKRMVLTKEGKAECKKVLEFKKYILEYSIMEKRDLEETIIWDKYLAYATAFGIPNKITGKIYEGWMNANIVLQSIEKIISLY